MLRNVLVSEQYRLNTVDETSLVVESALTVPTLLTPKLRIDNRGTSRVQVSIDEILDFGVSAEPTQTGTFTTSRVVTWLDPGEVLWHSIDAPYLVIDQNTKPVLRHNVRLLNTATSPIDSDIVGVLIFGTAEDITLQAPFPPTVVT